MHRVKGVISAVSPDIEAVRFRDNMPGVVDVRHLNLMTDGKKEQSLLLSLDEGLLPKLDYVSYVQKPFTWGKFLSKE